MEEQTTYKAARFFGRPATHHPDPFWFVAYPGQLFQGVAQYDWQTGLLQRQVYYMDAAHRIPIAKVLWGYDFKRRQVVKTWHWATGYGEGWKVSDPISISHSPAAFESLLQEGRQQILNHLMVQARQALGAEADKAISLFYSHYQQELLSWKQSGMAAAFHRALDTDAAQTAGYPVQGKQGEEPKGAKTSIEGEGVTPKAEQRESKTALEHERTTSESEQKEAAALSALLNRPLDCAPIPAGLKGKRVIDYIKYYIRWYGGYKRNYIYTAAEEKPRYMGKIYVQPSADYTGVNAEEITQSKVN